jgi:addiction module antitoxin, relB/dinJ family
VIKMSATTINIDEETKKEAQELFKDLGMNLTTAINIFLKQAIRERGLPFYVGQAKYKDEVYQAIKDAEQGKNLSKGYNDVEEMFEDILRDE